MKSRIPGQAKAWTPNESNRTLIGKSGPNEVAAPQLTFGVQALACLLFLATTASVLAGDVKDTLRFNLTYVPQVAAPPKIDGIVDKREWYGASLLPRLISADKGVAADTRARVYLCHDASNLYIAFQFDRPENALVPQVSDVFELLLDPSHDHKTAIPFSGNVESIVVGPSEWQYKAQPTGFGWEGEIAIPFESLSPNFGKDGEVWGFDFINHQMTPVEQPAGYSFGSKKGDAAQLSHIMFVKGVPPMRFEQLGQFWSEQGGGAVLEIANASDQPANLAVTMELFKRKPDAKGSYLARVVGGLQDGADIVLASQKELITEEIGKYTGVENGKTNAAVALPANRRGTVRVFANDIGEYLLQYRIARGDKVIGSGVLPYVLAPPIQLSLTPYHLSPGIVSAKTDLRKAKEWDKGAKAKFAVVKKAGDKPLSEVEIAFDGAREIDAAIPTRALDAGGYLVTMDLFGADGKKVGSLSEGFTKPPTPNWFKNPEGLTPVVPEPWKPIKAGGKEVSFLMGEYELGDLTLPAQINVQSIWEEKRVPIMTGPIALKGKLNGKEIVWGKSKSKITSKRPEIVEYESETAFEGLGLKTKTEFEYDGMAKVTLKMTPASGQQVAIDNLWIEFPLTKEFSPLYARSPTIDVMKDFLFAGLVPKAGLKHEFVHSVWLGNEERGFRWFSENWRGWHLGKKSSNEAIEVIPSETGTVLRINLFKDDKPFPITKEREIIFGYMFTPAKSLTGKTINHGLVHDRMEHTVGSHMNSGEIWFFPLQGWPIIPTPEGEADLQKLRDADKYAGWAVVKREEMRKSVELGHKYGARVVPYSGWFLPYESQEYKLFGDEMVSMPLRGGGCSCNVCCWNTAMTDVYTGLMADRIRDLDINGFRMDAGYSADACNDLHHTGYGSVCGWIDDEGKLQSSRDLFATRKAAQRGRRIFHGGVRKEGGLCLHHIHQGNRYDMILDHMDGMVSAEGGEMKMKALSEFPMDFFRANVMGDSHGWQVSYMPKTQEIGYDCRYGLSLLHNLTPRGSHMLIPQLEVSYSRSAACPTGVWAARDWIGPFEKGTELWGYWKNAKYLDTGNESVKGTFHVRRGEKLLLGMLNIVRKPIATTVRLDLKALGFKGKVYAYDLFDRADVEIDGDKIPFTFTGEGMRMLMISSKPFNVFRPEPTGENLIPEFAPDKWPKEGTPEGWQTSTFVDEAKQSKPTTKEVRVENGAIVIQGDGQNTTRLVKILKIEKGKSYVLEAEASIECDNGVFAGRFPDAEYFMISLGEHYVNDRRTLSSQEVAGRTEKIKLWFTAKEYCHVDLWMRNCKAKAIIKKLEVRELKNTPRRQWEIAE